MRGHGTRRFARGGLAAVCLAAGGWAGVHVAQDRLEEVPFDVGLTEETGVSLTFVDVEVRDERDRPVPGLAAEDFEVFLDLARHAVYSVDDLCACAFDGSSSGVVVESAGAGSPAPANEKPRFVLYVDFSQFMPDGKRNAREHASRWVEDVMAADDEAMIVAFGSRPGLRRLTPFTNDKAVLLRALDSAFADPSMDERDALELLRRRDDCNSEATDPTFECRRYATDEYFHTRRSLRALLVFLTRLQATPGRKEMLYFYQNTMVDPTLVYGGNPRKPNVDNLGNPANQVRDHFFLLDEVAGTAMVARTAVNPVFTGPLYQVDTEPENVGLAAVHFGANLADYTGGDYNKGPDDLPAMIEGVGRGCDCLYRIGLRPRNPDETEVHRMRVDVAGRTLRRRYRVQFLSGADRWLRKAEAVLLDPDGASQVPLRASLVPTRCDERGWDVDARVTLDPAGLLEVAEGPDFKSEWEVGAFLASSEGGKSWDMLGVSQARRGKDRKPDEDLAAEKIDRGVIVHQRRFDGLKPRQYEFRAFVRDRWSGEYGGAIAGLTLPPPGKNGLVGPIAMEDRAEHLVSALPSRGSKGAMKGRILEGQVPLVDRVLDPGETVEFHTWICSEDGKPSRNRVDRHVSRDGAPAAGLGKGRLERAGACFRFVDRLATGDLDGGAYSYHFRWRPLPDAEALRAEASFEIR